MRPARWFVTSAAVLALAACSSPTPAAAPPSASPAASPTPTAVSSTAGGLDAQGRKVCELAAAAMDPDKVMIAGKVAGIASAAAESNNDTIRLAAKILPDQYDDAVAAVGTDDEFATRTKLFGSVVDVQTECIKLGFTG